MYMELASFIKRVYRYIDPTIYNKSPIPGHKVLDTLYGTQLHTHFLTDNVEMPIGHQEGEKLCPIYMNTLICL